MDLSTRMMVARNVLRGWYPILPVRGARWWVSVSAANGAVARTFRVAFRIRYGAWHPGAA